MRAAVEGQRQSQELGGLLAMRMLCSTEWAELAFNLEF